MKKLNILLIASTLSIIVIAQDEPSEPLTNKKGIPILPQTGDWSIGIDATPFFQYIGNFFSGNNDYTPDFGFTAGNPGSIFGKYVMSSKTTIRGLLHIGITSDSEYQNNPTDPDNPHKLTTSGFSIGLTMGLEKYRNIYSRFRGIYGAQLGFLLSPYEDPTGYYGKASFENGNGSDSDWVEKGGRTSNFGLGVFLGVEFFVAPKVSLTGEFGLDFMGSLTSDRVREPAVGSVTTEDLGGSSISFAPVASGDLVLLFYF